MITDEPLGRAARLRFAHRAFFDADGTVRFLLGDGSAVRLSARQWDAAQAQFEAAIRPANRGLKWGFALAVPMMIVTLGIVSGFKLGKSIDAMGPTMSMLSTMATLCWWPFLMLYVHWRAIRGAQRDLDEQLSRFPPAPGPTARPRRLQALEIVATILFGPGILIDIIGSIRPHVFDGTPFMGRQLGLFSLVGLVALAAIILVPRWQRWRARAGA